MEKRVVIALLVGLVFLLPFASANIFSDLFAKITGHASEGFQPGDHAPIAPETLGPDQATITCMMGCMKCTSPGVGCTGNQSECQAKCNAYKPEQTSEEKCVEECALKGCGEYDFACQDKNKEICDAQCGMVKEPPAKSKEEQCIRDCVNAEDPGLICGGGEGGEKGNELCQKCAKSCENLYEGPCLDEIKLETKKEECNTCEHCYGAPVMGDSGEGYECIVNVECKDASSEFGDNPGTGEGIVQSIKDAGNAVVNFFKNLFSGSESENSEPSGGEA